MRKSVWVLAAGFLVAVVALWRMGAPGSADPVDQAEPVGSEGEPQEPGPGTPAASEPEPEAPDPVPPPSVTPADVRSMLQAPAQPGPDDGEFAVAISQAVHTAMAGPGAKDPAWGPVLEEVAADERLRRYASRIWTHYSNWARFQSDGEAVQRGLEFLAEQRRELAPLLSTEDLQLRFLRALLERASGELTRSFETLQDLDRSMAEMAVEDWERPFVEYLRSELRKEQIPGYLELGQPGAAKALVQAAAGALEPLDRAKWLSWLALEARRFGLVLRTARGAEGFDSDPTLSLLEGMALLRTGRAEQACDALKSAIAAPRGTAILRSNAALALIEALQECGEFAAARRQLAEVESACLGVPLLGIRWLVLDDELRHLQGDEPRKIAEIRDAYRQWLDTWSRSPIVVSGTRFVSSQRRIDVLAGVLIAEHRRGQDVRSMLERLLEAQSCGTLARRLQAPAVTVDELQAFLEAEAGGALIYVPAPGSPLAFSVDAETILFHQLEAETSLGSIHRDLRPMLDEASRGQEALLRFTRLADEVSTLIMPAEMLAHMKTWDVTRCVGVDLVTRLPPTLLRPGGDRWLGCQKRIVEWPSVPVGLALSSRAEASLTSPVAILDPTPGPESAEAALPFSTDEIGGLRALFGDGLKIRLGADATPAALEESSGELCYVHCHGRLDPEDPRPARLLLAGPAGGVSADAVEARFGTRHSAPAQIILAACEAGHGRVQLGEDGADQLAAAFFLCGTKTVLASHSDLFHEATKALVLDYLRELSAGAPPSEALRRARVSAVARGADPRDFGTLRLSGGAN